MGHRQPLVRLAAGGDRGPAPVRVLPGGAKEFYGLPHGLEGDVEDPTQPAPSPDRTIRNAILGRNAARAYGIDPDAARNAISCDAVNGLRQHGYLDGVGTPTESAPLASNSAPGARTRREVMKNLIESPWSP